MRRSHHSPSSARSTIPERVEQWDSDQNNNGTRDIESEAPASDRETRTDVLVDHRRSNLRSVHAFLIVENALRVAQPLMIAWAINDLLGRSYRGLAMMVTVHVLYLFVGSLRQRLVTQFAEKAAEDDSTRNGLDNAPPPSRNPTPSHRRALSIEYLIPLRMHVLFNIVGPLAILSWYDLALVPLCLVLLVPTVLLNAAYTRKCVLLRRHFQIEQDRESRALERGDLRELRRHLEAMGRWQSQLTNAAASNICLMELFVLGVLATGLAHYCLTSPVRPGDILAVVGYMLLFASGLRQVPDLVHSHEESRTSRLCLQHSQQA